MVEINRVWLNVDTDTNKITLFSRPRVSIRVDEYIWSLIEEHIVKPHKLMRSEKHKYLLKIAFGRFDPVRHRYYRDAIARYLYLGEREKALQTAERLATSRLWAVAGPTQVRPMSFFEDPNLREFLMEPESLRRIREAALIDNGTLTRK